MDLLSLNRTSKSNNGLRNFIFYCYKYLKKQSCGHATGILIRHMRRSITCMVRCSHFGIEKKNNNNKQESNAF